MHATEVRHTIQYSVVGGSLTPLRKARRTSFTTSTVSFTIWGADTSTVSSPQSVFGVRSIAEPVLEQTPLPQPYLSTSEALAHQLFRHVLVDASALLADRSGELSLGHLLRHARLFVASLS